MIIAKFICSILSIIISVFTFFSGTAYITKPGFGVAKIRLFGKFRDIFYPEPMLGLRYLLDEGYLGVTRGVLVWLAISALLWLFLQIASSRIIRLFANRKTDLHGSSRWATDKELRKKGLLMGVGFVLGQTAKATYKKKRAEKPKRKKGESRSDYKDRLRMWNPSEEVDVFKKKGELITQGKNAHTLIVGSTRSGKGVNCIIPTAFRWSESMIILDPKAECWQITSNFRSRFSWTFKFQPEKPDESVHYNPLLSIRRGKQAIPDIQNLSFILIPNNLEDKDPFWNNEARKLFAAVIGYVIYCEPPEKKTFTQVYSIFSNSTAMDDMKETETEDEQGLSPVKRYLTFYAKKAGEYLRSGCMPDDFRKKYEKRDSYPEKTRKQIEKEALKYLDDDDVNSLRRIQQDLVYFAGCEDKQLSSVVSTMTSQLQVIADPNVQSVTDRSDFTMEDFVYGVKDENGVNHPVSLYLCVSLSSLERLVPLIKIFYVQAITLLTRELDSKRPYRLLLIFDEFFQLGKMEIVEKALSLSAGYGILCAIAIQSFDQLRKLYQSEASFIDNFAYQVILKVSDESTSEKIEKILGQATRKHTSESFTGSMDTLVHRGEQISVQQMGRSLMTSAEIRAMDDNEILIIVSGEHPYKGKKIKYYMDDRFIPLYKDRKTGRTLPPPPISDNLPHPECIRNGVNEGIDSAGWHSLAGVNAYASLGDTLYYDDDEGDDARAEIEGSRGDYIDDVLAGEDGTHRGQEKGRMENEIDGLRDMSEMTKEIDDEVEGMSDDETINYLVNILRED